MNLNDYKMHKNEIPSKNYRPQKMFLYAQYISILWTVR